MMNVMRPQLPSADVLSPYIDQMNRTGQFTNFGPINQDLEDSLSKLFSRPVVTASSGTTALEIAITSLKLPPGSLILVPAMTYIATATSVRRCGHQVVVSDIDPANWTLTPERARDICNRYDIKLVIPVSIFGNVLPAQEWSQFQQDTGIPVLMDCAQSFGSQWEVGTCMAMFSMHATKALPAGEGGFIVTTTNLVDRQRSLTSFGQSLGVNGQNRMLVVEDHGTNAKLSEIHAAIALSILKNWPDRELGYRRRLTRYQDVIHMRFGNQIRFQSGSYHAIRQMFVIQFESELVRNRVVDHLNNLNIQTKLPYQPLVHEHPGFEKILGENIVNAVEIARTSLTIPFWLEMTDQDMETVCNAIADVLQ